MVAIRNLIFATAIGLFIGAADAALVQVNVESDSPDGNAVDEVVLTTKKAMKTGAVLAVTSSAGSASAGASIGKTLPINVNTSAANDNSNASTGDVSSVDVITANAPGVAAGRPIRYVATMKVDGDTSASVVTNPDSYNFAGGSLRTVVAIVTTNVIQDICEIQSNQVCRRTLRVVYDAPAGTTFSLITQTNVTAYASREKNKGSASASAKLNKATRIVLSSPVSGANRTGESGYTYD